MQKNRETDQAVWIAMRRSSKQSRSSPSHILKTPPNSPLSSSSPFPLWSNLVHLPCACSATVEHNMSKSSTATPSSSLCSSPSPSVSPLFTTSVAAIRRSFSFSLSLQLTSSSFSLFKRGLGGGRAVGNVALLKVEGGAPCSHSHGPGLATCPLKISLKINWT